MLGYSPFSKILLSYFNVSNMFLG